MNKRFDLSKGLVVLLCALAIGIYYQWTALTHPYVTDGDVRTHIYWMLQFRDPELFPNDLLTEYAKNRQPWGIVLVYYVFSFLIDPILFSKILGIFLFIISSFYIFKLGEDTGDAPTGFLAFTLFAMTPTFFHPMTGGIPRAFGYPLMILFLYYLVKKDYPKSAVMMVLPCLFYPVIFFYRFLLISFHSSRFKAERFYSTVRRSRGTPLSWRY